MLGSSSSSCTLAKIVLQRVMWSNTYIDFVSYLYVSLGYDFLGDTLSNYVVGIII